jgi:hypothetical protein
MGIRRSCHKHINKSVQRRGVLEANHRKIKMNSGTQFCFSKDKVIFLLMAEEA